MVITKRCSDCKIAKEAEAFGILKEKYLQSVCKECMRERSRNMSTAEKERRHNRRVQRKYGLTPQEYAELLFLQGGACAICRGGNKDDRRLAVDHDHKTGKVRGLLCNNCNRAIGLLQDDLGVIMNLVSYMEAGE
jgi:hypothetical protein